MSGLPVPRSDLVSALRDFARWGVRSDLTPTTRHRAPRCNHRKACSEAQSEIHRFYQGYIARIDQSVRERAAAALGEFGRPRRDPGPGAAIGIVRLGSLSKIVSLRDAARALKRRRRRRPTK